MKFADVCDLRYKITAIRTYILYCLASVLCCSFTFQCLKSAYLSEAIMGGTLIAYYNDTEQFASKYTECVTSDTCEHQ